MNEDDVDGQIIWQNSLLNMDQIKEKSKDLEFEQFYPKILVYKNLFKDLEKTMNVLKRI